MPPATEQIEQQLVPMQEDSIEIDELCISNKNNQWLWTAVSRYSGQMLAYHVGDRTWGNVRMLWKKIPRCYRHRHVYTDGYGAYASFFPKWQHTVCDKGSGGTSTVEGVNNSLRHRCGALVRRTSARCRDLDLLPYRLGFTVSAHNRNTPNRLRKRFLAIQNQRG